MTSTPDIHAEQLLARARHRFGQTPRVVLIDGRSGSGKTNLGEAVARAYSQPVESLLVEHLYPGWKGLVEGADAVATSIVTGRYRPYDWHAGMFGGEVSLRRDRPLVVEGCGALSRANLDAARTWGDGPVWGVWVECPAEVRRARALARDGDMYRPHWDSWAAQETVRIAREQPLSYAHHIIHTLAR